jgi:Domain of unknown function (DUF4124)
MLKCLAWIAMAWLCQSAVLAQTSTAAKPTSSVSTSTSTTATRKPSNTGEIYRWVDKNGKVQYSADVPEDRRSTAKKIDTRGNIVSSRVPASIGGAPAPAPLDDAAPAARKPVTEREKCEAAWQEYNAAQACFARYRQGTVAGAGKKSGVNVSPEALENCQNIAEPAACR